MKTRRQPTAIRPRPGLRRLSPPRPRAGWRATSAAVLIGALLSAGLQAAGTLKPASAAHTPIQIQDHSVQVVINNGFAITRVTQTFSNPNDATLEALYTFPLPKSSTLSEVTIQIGERVIQGEVLPRADAEQAYEEEKNAGNEAGLATKEGYKHLQFKVAPLRPREPVVVTFVYYQQLILDTGIARYVYPLEEGGTDDPAALSFWQRNDKVEGAFSFDLELKSAWPVADARVAGGSVSGTTEKVDASHWRAKIAGQAVNLNRDVVFYYRLEDNLPGRVELLAYRADASQPGTFMLVVTPGLDLKPLTQGADYTFVLDTSGSMDGGKLGTLADGVAKVLGQMQPADRFRVVTFSSSASLLTRGWESATPENAQGAIAKVKALRANGSTNLYDGLRLALADLDDDRASSIVLVTDGVTNTGEVSPAAFHKLMKQYDVRVFGFLIGNSANWPLMRVVCAASGGFYAGVSNCDDIIGQILLAKSKMLYECLHDATLRVHGVEVKEMTDGALGKVYRGQQLVFLGRYTNPGTATVELKARLTGEDKVYRTTFDFPAVDTTNPELERLWALDRVEEIERQRDLGMLPESEATAPLRDLGVKYQLVTDETAMVVLSDESFAKRGIERRNRDRLVVEHAAQSQRAAQPPPNRRVDSGKPAFNLPTPSVGGGGAIDPITGIVTLMLAAGAAVELLRERRRR
jgi:Ca-activated chloride channel family protein